ncbi:hypothetical protein [Mycoplasma sp. Ms02]|uniref:hypothetical protein n=1 Tax=Mycoplasma sp. Ms02 TaxID=353851 RepID=UPI001C8A1095|nr:hypothetical protein [Mycoplasma sp. Ms02]QZE12124.1 hypothetical protein K4L35_02115 [Mycoplasma sp. Ms02]
MGSTFALAFELFASKNNGNIDFNLFLETINGYAWRLVISFALINQLVSIICVIHLLYIRSKTEFAKWIPFAIIGSTLLLISPLTILFSLVGYEKNKIAFE